MIKAKFVFLVLLQVACIPLLIPSVAQAKGYPQQIAPTTDFAPSAKLVSQVKTVVADTLGVKLARVNATADFKKDLGATDADIIRLMMHFEEEFQIEVPGEDTGQLTNLTSAAIYIEKKMAAVEEEEHEGNAQVSTLLRR